MKLSYDNQGEFSKKLFIETYGCQMNVADSEVVASVMKMAGYDTTDTLDAADAIFINTCSIRDNAEQKYSLASTNSTPCAAIASVA